LVFRNQLNLRRKSVRGAQFELVELPRNVRANRLLTSRSRGAVVKARVVRDGGRGAPFATHLNYLQREGVTRDGEMGLPFGPDGGDADARTFAERCRDDRHHFRFIVSPDDALEMSDLRSFTRDLMRQAEQEE
jgi:type IV secretory pathway VirD2 relaxase